LLQQTVFSDEKRFCTPWGVQPAEAIEHFILQHPCQFDPERIRAEFVSDDIRRAVISHEDLLGYPIHGRYYTELAARRIAETFPSARVLVCIREQQAVLLSNYFQYVKQGGTCDLPTLLETHQGRAGFRPTFRLDHFEYDLTYRTLRRFFDADQILMLPLELLRTSRPEFFHTLFGFARVEVPDVFPESVANKRSTDMGLRLARVLNRSLPNPMTRPTRYADYPLRYRLRNRLVRMIDRFDWGGAETCRLQGIIDAHVGTYFDASNARLEGLVQRDLAALGYAVG